MSSCLNKLLGPNHNRILLDTWYITTSSRGGMAGRLTRLWCEITAGVGIQGVDVRMSTYRATSVAQGRIKWFGVCWTYYIYCSMYGSLATGGLEAPRPALRASYFRIASEDLENMIERIRSFEQRERPPRRLEPLQTVHLVPFDRISNPRLLTIILQTESNVKRN